MSQANPGESVDDIALKEMQMHTADELTRALSYKIEARAQELVERARKDVAGLRNVRYIPITLSDRTVAYADMPTLESIEASLKGTGKPLREAGINMGADPNLKLKSMQMPSVDAIDALIEKYSADIDSMLAISRINPINPVATMVRDAVLNYMKEQVRSVLHRPTVQGYEVLGRQQLEKIAGIQPPHPGTQYN